MTDVAASAMGGLLQVLAWPAVAFLFIGVLAGILVGLLPGISGAAALALCLPLTYTVSPVATMALLVGLASVTTTLGDVTSILFGVPGETTSAAMVLDGHALVSQAVSSCEAREAP